MTSKFLILREQVNEDPSFTCDRCRDSFYYFDHLCKAEYRPVTGTERKYKGIAPLRSRAPRRAV